MPSRQPDAVPAVVLAGGRASREFAEVGGVHFRALADLNGTPMVQYVLRALQEAKSITRVVLVAPSGFPDQPGTDLRVVGDGDLADNILAGLQACSEAEHALLVTADIPFLSPASVEDHVRLCLEQDADCCYTAVSREACLKRFPMMKRTWLRTPQGYVTGGNVVLQRLAAAEREMDVLRRAYRARKNPLFLAGLIGTRNVAKFAVGRLTLQDIEQSVSRILGVRCRLVLTPHADLATDVDRPEDLIQARVLLSACS